MVEVNVRRLAAVVVCALAAGCGATDQIRHDAGSGGGGGGSGVDAGPCPGLDERPDLNRNQVPDCSENLLANGQLATAASWQSTSRATFERSLTDARGFPDSGSARVVNVVAQLTMN